MFMQTKCTEEEYLISSVNFAMMTWSGFIFFNKSQIIYHEPTAISCREVIKLYTHMMMEIGIM